MIGPITSVLVLFGVGAAFAIAGLLGAVARGLGDRPWLPGRPAVAADLLIAAAAFGEAVIGLADIAPHAVLWSLAAVALVVVLAVFVLTRALCRGSRSLSLNVPAPRTGPTPDPTSTMSEEPGRTRARTPAADHPTRAPRGATLTDPTVIGPGADGGATPGDVQRGRSIASPARMLQALLQARSSTPPSATARSGPDGATSTGHGDDAGSPTPARLPGPIGSPGPGR